MRSFPVRVLSTGADPSLRRAVHRPQEAGFRRCEILGMGIDLIDYEETFAVIQGWRASGSRQFIVTATAADIQLSRDRRTLAASRLAGLSLPDGVGILMAARMLGYAPRGRVTGPELMLRICDRGRAYGYRHYFYGSTADVVDRLQERLGQQYPGLEIAGAYCPPFRDLSDGEDERVVSLINSRRPDVVWVGLGGTKQIRWMADHAGRIAAPALIGVGAAFNFHSGVVRWRRPGSGDVGWSGPTGSSRSRGRSCPGRDTRCCSWYGPRHRQQPGGSWGLRRNNLFICRSDLGQIGTRGLSETAGVVLLLRGFRD